VTVRNQTNLYAPIGEFSQTVGDILVEDSVFDDNLATGAFTEGGLVVNGVSGASIRIADSTFRRNTAAGDGGALHFTSMSVPTIDIVGSVFEENAAGGGGGAVLAYTSSNSVTIRNSVFRDNGARSGGAIEHSQSGTMTVSGSTFEDNSARSDGGAIFANSAQLTVSASTFQANAATAYAGAIWAGSAVVDISASQFVGNSADSAGGVYAWGGTTTTISTSTFRANTFGMAGGGILSDGSLTGSISIDSSTFSGHAYSGGGTPRGAAIGLNSIAAPGSFTLLNSTVDESLTTGSAFSVASIAGGFAIRNSTLRGASFVTGAVTNTTAVFENSILEALDPADDPVSTTVGAGGAFEISHSILSGALPAAATDGGGNLEGTAPQLGALADNGGPTQTRVPQPGSPAIDAGAPAFTAPPAFDQRGTGFARVTFGRLDIGAVEVQAQLLPATGGVVSWWLLPVAGGVLLLGIGGLVLARRARGARHSAR